MLGLQVITANLAGSIRNEVLEGREYYVVPVAMLTLGVHAGSKGPVFYPQNELSKEAALMAMNHKPIVVYHPERNGQFISACDPVVLNSRKVGLVMNTHWDGKKMRCEAWIDKDRAKAVDSRILDFLEKGKLMEVSTGLLSDNENSEGDFNGRHYKLIARNLRLDHLALLPDKVGACSLQDGCGMFQVNQGNQAMATTANCECSYADNKCSEHPLEDETLKNQGKKATTKNTEDEEETMEDEDTKKKKKGKYPMMNQAQTDQINLLIQAGTWNEQDRSWLESLDAAKLEKLSLNGKVEVAAKPTTIDEFLNNAPREFSEILVDGLNAHRAEKVSLVTAITKHPRNKFTANELEGFNINQLRNMAELIREESRSLNFSGAAGAIPQPTANQSLDDDPLPLPSSLRKVS